MGRPARIEFSGAVYHVSARGNQKNLIFRDDYDRQFFLQLLSEVGGKMAWKFYAWCLMDNHYHLVFETLEPNLCAGMKSLNGRYAAHFNFRHQGCGHLFQGRFSSSLIAKDSYLLEACRYAALNPVRAGLVKDPVAWPWSSFASLWRPARQDFPDASALLEMFDEDFFAAVEKYRQFVLEAPLPYTPDQSAPRGEESPEAAALPKFRPDLAELLSGEDRDQAIDRAHRLHGYSQREIAQELGLHPSSVNLIIKKLNFRA